MGGGASSDFVSLPRSVRTPIQAKYAAPAHLTMVNASADATSRAERPAVAARACTNLPTPTASADVTPARQPWPMPRAAMYTTAGPGVSNSTSDAPMKIARVESVGINSLTSPSMLRVSHGVWQPYRSQTCNRSRCLQSSPASMVSPGRAVSATSRNSSGVHPRTRVSRRRPRLQRCQRVSEGSACAHLAPPSVSRVRP